MVTITNHNKTIIHLCTTMRSRVTAKEVLPRVQAMMARDSPMSQSSATLIRFSGCSSTVAMCLPSPIVEATWHTAEYAMRQHYHQYGISSVPTDRRVSGDQVLTVAMMMMKSSQPKTRLKVTLTYSLIRTITSEKMAIVHITPCTVGARLSSREDCDTSVPIVNEVSLGFRDSQTHQLSANWTRGNWMLKQAHIPAMRLLKRFKPG